MPTFRVTGPDGAVYRVTAPDGATEQEVIEYTKRQSVAEQEQPPQKMTPAPKPDPQIAEGRSAVDIAMRALSGIRMGVEDPLVAAGQLITRALPKAVLRQLETNDRGLVQFNTNMGESSLDPSDLDRTIQRREATYQASRNGAGVDWARLGGNIVGTAPLAAVMPGPGATLLGTAARGAVTGGAVGSLQPVTDYTRDFWEQKGEQAAVGAIAGGITAPAIQALSRVISPRVDAAVKYLQERGVRPRPGQLIGPKAAIAEDKAMSLPIVGDKIAEAQRRAVEDFNRAAYNEVLKPLGQKYSGPVGRDGIAAVQDTLGKAYDDVLPKLKWTADPKFVGEFKKIAGMAKSLPPDKYTQFQRVMENELIPRAQGGTMDGISFKQLEGELSRLARTYASSSSADDRMLANGINEVLSSARSALERSNPNFAGQLRKINQAYATFTRVQDAAGRVGTEEGIFTPNHLLSAVRNMDRSARKGAFARGDALLQRLAEAGKKVIGVKYPDSGTAGRLANIGAGAALVTNPALTIGGGIVGSLPYTQTGQRIANALLTQRSPWARPVGEALNKVSVPGGGVVGPIGAGLFLAPQEEAENDYRYRR